MRCPYCGGFNQEQAAFCVSCGRDLRRPLPNTQPQHPSAQPPYRPGSPAKPTNQPVPRGANPPVQQPRPANWPVQEAVPASRRQASAASKQQVPAPTFTSVPSAPEPPGPFPPRTMAQLEALLATGCQTYTVVESHVENGKKQIMSITYPRCASWQQAATLLKALKEHHETKYPIVVIKGVSTQGQGQDMYEFSNGQLQFDRGVYLGAKTYNRYAIETGNGYSADSVRFVLNE